jgi:hypothetical protein
MRWDLCRRKKLKDMGRIGSLLQMVELAAQAFY